MSTEKMYFFAKNNSLVYSCLFAWECLILQPYFLTSAMLNSFLQSAEKQDE